MAGRPAEYGMSCSPLVVDDMVIVTAGGQGKAVVALDRKSGDSSLDCCGRFAGVFVASIAATSVGSSQVVAFTAHWGHGASPV